MLKDNGLGAIRRVIGRRPHRAEGESNWAFRKRVSDFNKPKSPKEYTAKCRALEKISASLDDIIEVARLLAVQNADDKKICNDVEKVLPVRKLSKLLYFVLWAEIYHGRYWDNYIDLLFAGAKDILRREKEAYLILQIGIVGDERCNVREAIRGKKKNELPLFLQSEKAGAADPGSR